MEEFKKIDSNKKLKHFYTKTFNAVRNSGKVKESFSENFGQIGSTPLEDIYYEDQLAAKLQAIKQIFETSIEAQYLDKLEIVPSPETEHYRFRMDYVCSHNPIHEPHNRFGQRKRNNFSWVIDMKSCILVPLSWFNKTREVYEKLLELGIQNYDLKTHEGNLRYLVLRQFKEEGMLNLVTRDSDDETKSIIEAAASLALQIGFKSINWVHQPSLGDRSEGEVLKTFGSETITVKLQSEESGRDLILLVGSHTFFQNNIAAFQQIVHYVRGFIENYKKHMEEAGRDQPLPYQLYDLYSGVGTFGILLSDLFEKVYAFEINEDSVKLAKANAQLNNITNIESVTADLNDPDYEVVDHDQPLHNKVLIVDPPRTGLENNGIEHVLKLDAHLIVYISCNPITQAIDLERLQEKYQILEMKAFDLFPHTYHMENVIILKRIG